MTWKCSSFVVGIVSLVCAWVGPSEEYSEGDSKMLCAGWPPSTNALSRRWSLCMGECFAACAMGGELLSPRALVWSYSSPVVMRALSDLEELVAARGSVMFSRGCFAAEGFSVDTLPPRSSSLLADALLLRLLEQMLCCLEGFHLPLHFTAGYQHVELFCIRFSYMGLSCGGSPTSCLLLLFVWWTSLVIHRLLANSLFQLLCHSVGSSA